MQPAHTEIVAPPASAAHGGGVERQVRRALPHGSGPFIGLLLLCLAGVLLNPSFATVDNAMNVMTRTAFIGIIAVGMCFVIVSGGIDLSVGSMAALIAGCTILLMNAMVGRIGSPALVVALGMAFTLALGALFGLAHGLLITKGKIEPFIVTLGTMGIYRGLTSPTSPTAAPSRWKARCHGLPAGVFRLVPRPSVPSVSILGVACRRARPLPMRLRPLRAGRRLERAGGALSGRRSRPRAGTITYVLPGRVRRHRRSALRAAAGLAVASDGPAVGAAGDHRRGGRRHGAQGWRRAASRARSSAPSCWR